MMDATEKKDIFDKIMGLPGLRILEPFYKKYKEILLYLFFGGLAVVLNIGLFAWFDLAFGMEALINNIICWVICVLFQFFTNRIWVFQGHDRTDKGLLWKQMGSFFVGRLFTLGVEELILLIFIVWLGFDAILVKVAAQVVTIILNYIVSKLFVFRTKHV